MSNVIRVSAAIVIDNEEILIAQRREDKKNALMWEFAGGKIEKNENAEESLEREFIEEFNMNIKVGKFFNKADFTYDFGTISLEVYFAKTLSGRNVQLNAHKQIAWVKPKQLIEYEFTPPDRVIMSELLELLQSNSLSLS